MPTIYLSPSIQPYNKYLTEGDEQYWMNRIADDMVPMLEQNGINVVRNTPNTSLGQSPRDGTRTPKIIVLRDYVVLRIAV